MKEKVDRFEEFAEEAYRYLKLNMSHVTTDNSMRGIGYAILALAQAVRESGIAAKNIKLSGEIGTMLSGKATIYKE